MDKKIHPLILLNLFINSIVTSMFAYDKSSENEIRYGISFIALCVFFVSLTIYGLMKNSKINRTK
jgi:hypothetical protein